MFYKLAWVHMIYTIENFQGLASLLVIKTTTTKLNTDRSIVDVVANH